MVDKIIGHWAFDESSGQTAFDSTTNNNHGIVYGTSVEDGLFGKARVFVAGNEDRVEIDNASDMYSFTDDDFTISVWFKLSSTPSVNAAIFSKFNAIISEKSYLLSINNTGKLSFIASADGTTNSVSISSSSPVNDGSWHLATVTRGGIQYRLYVDGIEIDSELVGSASIFYSSEQVLVGNASVSSSYDSAFDGYIDDVKVYNFTLSDKEVSELFYNTTYDPNPPYFILETPKDRDIRLSTYTDIVFKFADESPNLDTLNLTINGYDVLSNGLALDGYNVYYQDFSDGYSDGYDGYLVTITTNNQWQEGEYLNVEIDAADAYGNFNYLQFKFATSSYDPPPSFDNFNPLPYSNGHGSGDAILFQFNDGYAYPFDLVSGADITSLNVTIDGESAIVDGTIQSNFYGSIIQNGYDGFNISINKYGGWRDGRRVELALSGRDLNGTYSEYLYYINLGGGPIISTIYPGDGYIGVDRNTSISFEIADAIFGIDIYGGTNIFINDEHVIIDGSGLTHDIVFNEIDDGYVATIYGPTLPEYDEVNITAIVKNNNNNTNTYNYYFTTADETPPSIEFISPQLAAQRVNVSADIVIKVTDGYSGVNLDTFNLIIDGSDAIINLAPQAGYSLLIDNIEDGYLVSIAHSVDFDQFSVIQVFASVNDNNGNFTSSAYHFSSDDSTSPAIVNKDPDNNQKKYIDTDVLFSMHDFNGSGALPDLLNVTIDSNLAIVDGQFQPGYSGSIAYTFVNGYDGYDVIINPDSDFGLGSNIPITIDIKDAYGNQTIENYYFIASETTPPEITHIIPIAESVTSIRPTIQFFVHDNNSSGVDRYKINAYIDGIHAISDGYVLDEFDGFIENNVVDGIDGFSVLFTPKFNFDHSYFYTIDLDAYDIQDNRTQLSYSLITSSDNIIPSIIAISPEGGETGVELDASIEFQINDLDQYSGLVDLSRLSVFVDNTQAIYNGAGQNNYIYNYFENDFDGYDIIIYPPSALPEFTIISVDIDGYDSYGNNNSYTYSFRTKDITPPTVSPIIPFVGQSNVSTNSDVILSITDGYSGINLDSLYIHVNNKLAVSGGYGIDGYELGIVEIQDGYQFELAGSVMNEWQQSLVSVAVYDNDGNQRQYSYSFTTGDFSGPYFENISPEPYSVDVQNNTDIRFDIVDPNSGVDLYRTCVFVDGDPLLVNGVPQDGATLTITSIQNGFNLEIDEIVLNENQTVNISIDGYDLSGNHGNTLYSITGAYESPAFTGFDPPDSSLGISTSTNIEFDFTDAYGVNINTLDVYIYNALAVIGGIQQDGYSISYSPINNGYHVVIGVVGELPSSTYIGVDVFGEDNNGILGQESIVFRTASSIFPAINEVRPAAFSYDQNENDDVEIRVGDPAQNGILKNSINVYVNFTPAVISGVGQDGYDVSIINNYDIDGYNIIIEHDRFEPYSRIYVSIEATNFDNNTLYYEYYYDVGEKSFPDVVNRLPNSNESDVIVESDISFDVIDRSGVDLNSIIVTIEGITAFKDGTFRYPFDDENSIAQPQYDYEEVFAEPIYGYDEIDGYYLDGYDGYDGYNAILPAYGYHFNFDYRLNFTPSSTINVSVFASDLIGNYGTRSYLFYTELDAAPPIISNFSPAVSETNVLLSKDIAFRFVDSFAGATLSSLNVSVAGRPAIVGGTFQDGYFGSTVFIGDGYDVVIGHQDAFPNYSTIQVYIYAEDLVGNSSTVEYDFITEDVNAPIFDSIHPIPGSITQSDTSIRFSFNDRFELGSDISTLCVRVLGSLIVNGGNAADGYEITYTGNLYNGYDVEVFFNDRLPDYNNIDIVLSGSDFAGNIGSYEFSFTTADESPPVFDNLIPNPNSVISTNSNIYADIIDYGSGVNLNSLGVSVNNSPIISNGHILASGFVSELVPIDDGYRLCILNIGPLAPEADGYTVALYNMDSLILNNVVNSSGNASLDGTAIGPTLTTGIFDNSLSFTTLPDRVEISADNELRIQSISIEALVKPNSIGTDQTIYCYNPQQTVSSGRGLYVQISSLGAIKVLIGDGMVPLYSIIGTSGLVNAGVYSHILVRISTVTNSISIYVNGNLDISTTLPVSTIEYNDYGTGSPLVGVVLLGNRISPLTGTYLDQFIGTVDFVKIYNKYLSDGESVNSYNRTQSIALPEYSSIPVSIFVQDNYGNDGYIDYEFRTLDESPPILSNFSPHYGQSQVSIFSSLSFDFTDAYSGVDLSSLNVIVNNTRYVDFGVAYNVDMIVSNIVDGYNITIDFNSQFEEFSNIHVFIDGYDFDQNYTSQSYYFFTDDITGPKVIDISPNSGSVAVNPFSDIMFVVHDYNASGVNVNSISVQIDNSNAIINGVAQENWNVDIAQIYYDGYFGYEYTISPPFRFALNSLIPVYVDGYDAYGNYFSHDYSFETYNDQSEPSVITFGPHDGDTNINLDSDILFDIIDGYDIDISRLNVHVSNAPAIIGGIFQTGFDGSSSGIYEIIDGYSITIDPTNNYDYNQQISVVVDGYDLSDNHIHYDYYFHTISDITGPIITNKSPDQNDVEVELNSNIEFNITDSAGSGVDMSKLMVYVDNVPAIINGAMQSGWDGSSAGIESILDGYHIVIDPHSNYSFEYNQIHVVTIDGYDNADNHSNEVYSFATILDSNPPILSAFSPLPGSDEIYIDTNISFNITDTISGVDITQLDVYVNYVPAIVDGAITYPFNDSSASISAIQDGYTVTLDSFIDFNYNDIKIVIIDGYDYAGNHINYEYSFITKVDVDGPSIIPIYPLNSVGGYSRSTNIEVKIIDQETGVDLSRVDITADNSSIFENGEFVVNSGFDGSESYILQLVNGYQIYFDHYNEFLPGQTVRVIVDGYDFSNNQSHYEYIFTTVDDIGPEIYYSSPIANSVNAPQDPIHISFGIRDVGIGAPNLNSILVEVSSNFDETFVTVYDNSNSFQNGWYGSVNNNDDADGYVFDLFRVSPGNNFDLFTIKVTVKDNFENQSINVIGKDGGLIVFGTGIISGPYSIDVGSEIISTYGIDSGDLIVVNNVGAFSIDGYTTTDIVVSDQISSSGIVNFTIYRGSFLLERKKFGLLSAESTSNNSIVIEYMDEPTINSAVLDTSSYTIYGGDYDVSITSVSQLSSTTFEILTGTMQALITYYIVADTENIFDTFDFSIDDGYETAAFVGYPDSTGPNVIWATNSPFNINVTVIFSEAMKHNAALVNPNSYLLTNGAYVTSVEFDEHVNNSVILTTENLFGRSQFTVYVVSNEIMDVFDNVLNSDSNFATVDISQSQGALSGINGVIKTSNIINKVFEDSNNWYLATAGGIDVVGKIDLENKGFILDAYGVSSIITSDNAIYFGKNDGYDIDAYGLYKLELSKLNKNSTNMAVGMFGKITLPSIVSNIVNDIVFTTNAEDIFIAVATDFGISIVKNELSSVNYNFGINTPSICIDDSGSTLYAVNNTMERVDVYYNINLDSLDRGVPDAYYSIPGNIINQIKITNNTSIINSTSNTLYIGTNNGLIKIDTDESIPGSSETGFIITSYGVYGSGCSYDILGGSSNNVIVIDINTKQKQLFIATIDNYGGGGLTIINTPSNTMFSFMSTSNGLLISNEISDITFKNL